MKKLEIKRLSKEIAKNLKKGGEDLNYLVEFCKILKEKPKTLNLLSNPLIPFEVRRETFLKTMDILKIPKVSKAILYSLFKNYILGILIEILEEIEKEKLKMENVLPVDIFLSTEVEDDLKEKVIKYLEEVFCRKIKPNFHLKPELLGGFEAISESYHINASIDSFLKLFKLKEEIWQ